MRFNQHNDKYNQDWLLCDVTIRRALYDTTEYLSLINIEQNSINTVYI